MENFVFEPEEDLEACKKKCEDLVETVLIRESKIRQLERRVEAQETLIKVLKYDNSTMIDNYLKRVKGKKASRKRRKEKQRINRNRKK